MVYVEHYAAYVKYLLSQTQYDAIITEKERLFAMTQPKAVNFDKERVTGGNPSNTFDEYVIAKDQKQIDARLAEIKSILDDRKELLKLKEQELRSSKDWQDIIYTYYYIDKLSIRQIEHRIPYSRRQIYRLINIIKSNLR